MLNLDANQNNYFLVYNDETIIIENDDQNINVVIKADDKSKEYFIKNIDEK